MHKMTPIYFLLASLAFAVSVSWAQESPLPIGLFDPDPQVRLAAIKQVAAEKNTAAIGKLASMVRADVHAGVRRDACEALGQLKAEDQLDLLSSVATTDANAEVRAAAEKAVKMIKGEAIAENRPIFIDDSRDTDTGVDETEEETKYKKPTILVKAEPEPQTRILGIGFGSMGGYGIASMDLKVRIKTSAKFLPWIGIEAGGGWSPPGGYQLIVGRINEVEGDYKWKILSGGAAVLFHLHREHYIPLRGGFDIGQGPYGQLGYGYEQINHEGFFSWGFEVGMSFHPGIDKWIDHLVDCEASDARCTMDDLWPVVPFMRFCLHFYPV